MSTITVNGEQYTFSGDPNMPLLWYLRDEIGLTGTKFGCGDRASAAPARSISTSDAVRSCLTTLAMADGKSVTTIEGLSSDGEHPVQMAWRQHKRAAVRLLPGRTNHAGRGAADQEPRALR